MSLELVKSVSDLPNAASLAELSDAPIFYSTRFLAACEASPLQRFDSLNYLVDEGLFLPVIVQVETDPLGTIPLLTTSGRHHPMLLSHILHCYDTRIPCKHLDQARVKAVVDAVKEIPLPKDVRSWALINVAADSELSRLLAHAGLRPVKMDSRFQLDLSASLTMDNYLSNLAGHHRRNLLRHVRRAQDDGVVATRSDSHLDLIGLLRETSSKHEAEDYYPAVQLPSFLHPLGDSVVTIRVSRREQTLATAICFRDGRRFHQWAAGVRYDLTSYSPYYFLFLEMMKAAFESGAEICEGGRGNGQFKTRFGMREVPLVAWVGALS